VDNLAPRVTQLSIERQPNQYFGPNVFELDHAAGGTVAADPDGECDAPCARTVDYGVGGTEATFLAGPLGEEVTVTDGGPELEESATSEDYVFAVMVTDNTGNTDTRWATDPAETGEDVSYTTNDAEDDEDILQFFGWDATAPSIEIVTSPDDMEVNPDEAVVSLLPIDESEAPAGPSGFLADPFSVKVTRYLPGSTTCRSLESPAETYAAISCTTGGAGFRDNDGDFPLPEFVGQEGYFEYTIRLEDAAGNPAEELMFWILQDVTAPDVGGINSPSTIEGGESVTFEAEDNVELGSVIAYLGFDAVELGMPREVVGSFGFDAFDDEIELSVTTPRFIRSFQLNNGAGLPGAGPFMTNRVVFNVRDIAGERLRFVVDPWGTAPDQGLCPVYPAADVSTQNCTNTTEDIEDRVLAGSDGPVAAQFDDLATLNGVNPLHGLFLMQPPSESVICNNADRTDCPDEDTPISTQVSATATGPAGSFANPFSEVRFYFQNTEGRFDYIGSASVSVSDNTVESTRTFTYRATWNPTNPKVRPAGVAGTAYTVVAVGIDSDGDALGATPSTPITVHGN
jgi:hypothetical protein